MTYMPVGAVLVDAQEYGYDAFVARKSDAGTARSGVIWRVGEAGKRRRGYDVCEDLPAWESFIA